ncbi:MAG: HAD-IA family hydrolase [Burkholderiales bacterium]|nr:HAD-IA family hydrolase [Burkholderiales bacterium]
MTSRPGLLFDLDGTLVETDPVHFAAFNDILSRNGRPTIDQHVYDSQIIGFQNADIFARLFPDRTVDEHARLADEKEALFRSRAGELRPAEGLLDLLDWADGSGIPIAVVTNAPRANATMMLESLGLAGRFSHVVIGDEMTHPKPHPMPYLVGLERIGAEPGRTVAFEDSRSGVRSASGAGLTVVGMSTSLEPEALTQAGADYVARDFTDAGLRALVMARTGSA